MKLNFFEYPLRFLIDIIKSVDSYLVATDSTYKQISSGRFSDIEKFKDKINVKRNSLYDDYCQSIVDLTNFEYAVITFIAIKNYFSHEKLNIPPVHEHKNYKLILDKHNKILAEIEEVLSDEDFNTVTAHESGYRAYSFSAMHNEILNLLNLAKNVLL